MPPFPTQLVLKKVTSLFEKSQCLTNILMQWFEIDQKWKRKKIHDPGNIFSRQLPTNDKKMFKKIITFLKNTQT